MTRYFLHLRDSTDEVLDPEGSEFTDMESLRSHVLMTARDLIGHDARLGVVDFRFRIDAEYRQGEIVYSLPFKHAVSIIPED